MNRWSHVEYHQDYNSLFVILFLLMCALQSSLGCPLVQIQIFPRKELSPIFQDEGFK